MARFLYFIDSFAIRKCDKLFLAFSWAVGLGVGGLVFRFAGSNLGSLMPLAAVCQPSIFGLLTTAFLPYLFSVYAVYFRTPGLLYGVCFLKAFLFGYMYAGVMACFGGAGWLVRWLLLFSDAVGLAVLYLFCHRHISGIRKFSCSSVAIYASVLFTVVWTDYRIISPLLRRCLL